jgi:hypothetical protein
LRAKKRYVLFERVPEKLPTRCEFIFQSVKGYVYRMSPKAAQGMRRDAILISGSIRKIKSVDAKTSKVKVEGDHDGMK